MYKQIPFGLFAICLALLVQQQLLADEFEWAGSVDTTFSNPDNWIGGRLPDAGDSVTVNTPADGRPLVVTSGEDLQLDRFQIGTANGIVGRHSVIMRDGQIIANEIRLESDDNETSRLLLQDGNVETNILSFVPGTTPEITQTVTIEGGILRLGVGGMRVAGLTVPSTGSEISLRAGTLDATASGSTVFQGVARPLSFRISGGALLLAGNVSDVTALSENVRFQPSFTCGGSFDLFHFYDPQTDTTRVKSGVLDVELLPGDADQDLDFDQVDLVQVLMAGKYRTGEPATWGEGDWDGAPGGHVQNPPPGDGLFNQLDIVAALGPHVYLTGSYCGALRAIEHPGVEAASLIYHADSGEIAVDVPTGMELTSINLDSAAGIFTGDAAENLGGGFDYHEDSSIFKATFGSSFGSITFGKVAQPGLSQEFVLNDLSVRGSLAGRGELGTVDLIYTPIPEPMTAVLMVVGLFCVVFFCCYGREITLPTARC